MENVVSLAPGGVLSEADQAAILDGLTPSPVLKTDAPRVLRKACE
jgi:hypothetical protein